MVDYGGIFACSYGTTGFQAVSYALKQSPIVKEGVGRTGTRVEVTIAGTLEATDAAGMFEAVSAAQSQLSLDGQNLILTGLGGQIEYALLAAQCLYGAPHVDFEIADSDKPLVKDVKFTARAEIVSKDVSDAYKVSLAIRPDGLRTITRSGEINDPQADSDSYFASVTLPGFRKTYPLPDWVVDVQYDSGMTGTNAKVSYKLTARENYGSLPGSGQLGEKGVRAVDGQASVRTDRDEQMRKTTTFDFDLLVDGDATDLLTQLRTQASAGGRVILRESFSTESVKENRLKATFTILESGGNNAMMNWQESLRLTPPGQVYEERTYVGAAPILVRRPDTIGRLQQAGSAVAVRVFKREPSPVFRFDANPRQITLTDQNDVEKKTDWTYDRFLTDNAGTPLSAQQFANFGPAFITRANQDNNFYPPDPKLPNVANPNDNKFFPT